MNEPIQTEDLEAKAAEAMGGEVKTEEASIEKIKIGEDEYTPEEAQALIGLGKIGKEAEEKWNTKIDSLFPAYSKSQNEKKELEERIKSLEGSKEAEVLSDPSSTPNEVAEAKKVLKEQFGLVDKDEVKNIFNELLNTDKATSKLLSRTSELEGKINGEDGRPAFKTEEVLTFMAEQGIKDPETAYKVKHEKELDAWKESQIGKAKTNGLVTESSSTAGGKVPSAVKIDNSNLIEVLKESMG